MVIKASWIGLGVMGFPMAGHLTANADVELTVYNRSPEKAEIWVQKYKGKVAATPGDAAAHADRADQAGENFRCHSASSEPSFELRAFRPRPDKTQIAPVIARERSLDQGEVERVTVREHDDERTARRVCDFIVRSVGGHDLHRAGQVVG